MRERPKPEPGRMFLESPVPETSLDTPEALYRYAKRLLTVYPPARDGVRPHVIRLFFSGQDGNNEVIVGPDTALEDFTDELVKRGVFVGIE